MEDINKAIQLESNHEERNYLLGKIYESKKEYDNAARYYGNFVKLNSNIRFPDAIYLEGNCNYENHNYQHALVGYSRCLELKMDSIKPSFNSELANI